MVRVVCVKGEAQKKKRAPLIERLGGPTAINAAVDVFYIKVRWFQVLARSLAGRPARSATLTCRNTVCDQTEVPSACQEYFVACFAQHCGAGTRCCKISGAAIAQVLADERVNHYFSGTDMHKQRAHQVGTLRQAQQHQTAIAAFLARMSTMSRVSAAHALLNAAQPYQQHQCVCLDHCSDDN